jgi:pyruvate formate lyase activating enzyme
LVLAKEAGMKTSIVSNGYIKREPLLKLLRVLDAVKIDLKGFSEEFYEKICLASMKPVLESLQTVKKENVWLEVVNLVIPTLNDDPRMINDMCRWIKKNLGIDTPLHLTRFHPDYKLTHLSPTPLSTLDQAYDIAKKNGLRYVYLGNVPGHAHNSTYCLFCNLKIIHRTNFDVLEMNMVDGKCRFCGAFVPGKWS